MEDRFARLQDIVLGRLPLPDSADDFTEGSYRRLLKALRGPIRAGAADLASLVRHVLRREEARQEGVPQELWVPQAAGWPTAEQWQAAGVEVRSAHGGRYRVRAREWSPNWLPLAEQVPPCRDVEAEVQRRNFVSVAGDACLSVVGRDSYRCGAQREMVRGVLTAPPGSTLLCNLPTGAGKSLVAQLPALLQSRRQGLTIVVVPTTALCMDQERSIASLVPHPTAYHGGAAPGGGDRRQEILRRIADGTQRIVFTSPESVIGSLSSALYRAAERRELRLLAIDEAHIVSEWGGEFRSSFQELAGIRRDLLRVCGEDPFVTLLMTATLTQECLRTLETLFADPGPFAVTSAVQLRPEPAYWVAECLDETGRIERALEAVRHLPRPLILYTTRRVDADAWFRLLRAEEFRRCAVVTGATGPEERQRVVEGWKTAEYDIVVATSAFGLGVDQAEVRAVVHACVPESIDRFYQEVGRGGRDGKACLSLVLHTPADLEVAAGLSRETLIGVEKGLARWRRMFVHKEVIQAGLFRVPIDIAPGLSVDRIDMVSERNQAWNINTLTLMSRAGLLRMDAEPPPIRDREAEDAAEADQVHRQRLDLYRRRRVVRVLDESHASRATWEARVEPVRREAWRDGEADFGRMREVLRGARCVADILAESYRIQAPGSGPVHVVGSCGGCPACRVAGRRPFAGPLPEPLPPWQISRTMGDELSRLLGDSDALAVFYDEVELHAFGRFLRWLLAQGVRSAVLPADLPTQLRETALEVMSARLEPPVFVDDAFQARRSPRVPTVILHPRGREIPWPYLPSEDGSGIPRVLFLPGDVRDPNGLHRRLRDVIDCRKFRFVEFLRSQGL